MWRRDGALLAVAAFAATVAAALTYVLITARRIIDLVTDIADGDTTSECDWGNPGDLTACVPGGIGNITVAMAIVVIGTIVLSVASARAAAGTGFVAPGLVMTAWIGGFSWLLATNGVMRDENVEGGSRLGLVVGALVPLAIGVAIGLAWRRSRADRRPDDRMAGAARRTGNESGSLAPWLGALLVGALVGVAIGFWYADRVV